MSDDLAALLRRRRMVRDFADAPVADEQLQQVLDAALATPSAGHAQVVSLVVLRGKQVDAFWRTTSDPDADSAWLRGMRRAPVLVTVWTSEQGYAERYAEADKRRAAAEGFAAPWWWVDAGMSVLAMLLTVTETGLAACFFGVPADRQASLA
uniref:nitroreductase family protein n=1 Tax=Desertihabitans aurantiacus TaxID=2282477 RepID=UPI000DF75CEB